MCFRVSVPLLQCELGNLNPVGHSLHSLREITLRVRLICPAYGFMRLCNDNLKSLIPLWPELVLFEYNTHHNYSTGTSVQQCHPTLDTIFAFARAHPRLLHLELPRVLADRPPCGLDGIPPQLEDTSPPLEGHGLLWFKVGWPMDPSNRGAPLEHTMLAIDRAFPQVLKEIQRRRALNPYSILSYFEKQFVGLHVKEDAHGEERRQRDEQPSRVG